MSTERLDSAQTVTIQGPPRDDEDRPHPTETLDGRYRLLGELGVGGMGVVYRARDERLDRPVAIKMLRRSAQGVHVGRMQREAQAVAQLAHPNVVEVFDVGVFEGHPYLVMEALEGQTLAAWVQAHPRPGWRRIVAAYLQAAAGLAAAHRLGIVHRDFKPGNTLITADGRVRVLDFGLARTDDDSTSPSNDATPGTAPTRLPHFGLTRTGVAMGTPAYMAPEQHRGVAAGVAADIYAFGVSLYEALYGERPFDGLTFEHLAALKLRGPGPLRPDRRVPLRIHDALLRAMAARPEDRWPTLDAMVAELRRASGRRRTYGALAVGGGILTILAALSLPSGSRDPCQDVPRHARAEWAAARPELAAALQRAEVPAGGAQAVLDRYQAYVQDWAAAYTQACNALDEPTSSRLQCLEQRHTSWRAAILLGAADSEGARGLASGTSGLDSVESCADPSRARIAPLPTDPHLRDRVRALDAWAHRYSRRRQAGASPEPEALARAQREGRVLGHAPTLALVLLLEARDASDRQEYDASIPAFVEAFFHASTGGDERRAAVIALGLAQELASKGEMDGAQRWLDHAQASMARVESLDDGARQLFMLNHSATLLEMGRAQEALELVEPWFEPQAYASLELGNQQTLWSRRGSALHALGRSEGAAEAFERALAEAQRFTPPDHPDLVGELGNAAIGYEYSDRLDEAVTIYDRILAIGRQHWSEDDPRRTYHESNAGFAFSKHPDRQAEGIALLTEVARRADAGDSVMQRIYSYGALGEALQRAGRRDDSIAAFHHAQLLALESLGPDHPLTLQAESGLARARHTEPAAD